MSCKLAVALVLTLAPCFAGATEARSRLPDGYVPAPTGKGWSEGPNMWREYDHAGRRVVKCLAGTQDESFATAPTGGIQSCDDSQRKFAGATQANATRVIRDHEGNRWDVYVSDRTERWTDAYGNVTTCRYEAGFKTCKFPDPSTIKVATRSKATAG